MRMLRFFHNLPIRHKLLLSCSAVCIPTVILGNVIIYSLVAALIENNIQSELENSTASVRSMAETSVQLSAKNYLRTVADKNKAIVSHFYAMYKDGSLSEVEAMKKAESALLDQKVGETGYIHCIKSDGTPTVHPKKELLTQNFISNLELVKEQIEKKEGYIEYEWMDPQEDVLRRKALYMTYFAPWDWIISASTDRSEFSTLVNLEEIRAGVLSLRFGKTGYSFVLDGEGNTIVHPKLGAASVFDIKDAGNRKIIKQICDKKSGRIVYPWINPDEDEERNKLAIFNYIPDLDWIVGSSIYPDEFYAPLETVRNLLIAIVVLSFFLLFMLTRRISTGITNPLQRMTDRIVAETPGGHFLKISGSTGDEPSKFVSYFNFFMEKVKAANKELPGEILKRKQIEEKLRLSEEMFSKVLQSSSHWICTISSTTGRFLTVNNAFMESTGYDESEIIDKTLMETNLLRSEPAARELLDLIEKYENVSNIEIEIFTKTGERRRGMLTAHRVELPEERSVLMIVEDITDKKALQKEMIEIGRRERQKIGRELHDDLCSHLLGIEVLSEVLGRKLVEESSRHAPCADQIKLLTEEAVEKARKLAKGLCSGYPVASNLGSSLRELCAKADDVFGIACEFRSSGTVEILDDTTAAHLFHMVQEAVQNAIRHGKAQSVIISLSSNDDLIELKVTDNGTGIPNPVPATGTGLRIMSRRAEKIGGVLQVKRNPEAGTVVECLVRVPVKTEAMDEKARL